MKILVAGIGNVFLGDDGFGPAVAGVLAARAWPDGVAIRDFGIRGMDLALALTSGIDAAILVDATARGGAPGTLYVIEPSAIAEAPIQIETHALDPARVLRFAGELGEVPRWMRVVGCEPQQLGGDDDDDVSVGLSDPVARAVAAAAELVARLVEVACTS